MSRFRECNYEPDEDEIEEYERALEAAYATARPLLVEFLAFLDAMPRKRIISGRFMATASGDVCAVGAFCLSRGVERKEMLETERDSRLRRMSEVEDDYGDLDPTVYAGKRAGLPEDVVHDLGYTNDLLWWRVLESEKRTKHCTERTYRAMTPEERWLKLRAYIAKKIEEPNCNTTA